MTKNYIEIIKRSPYYYQIDGMLLEKKCPDVVCQNFWNEWKHNLPDCYEKEKVFLDLVCIEQRNKRSFMDTMRKLSPILDKDFVGFLGKERETIETIYKDGYMDLVIPTEQYWNWIKRNLKQCHHTMETVPHFFLRIALQYYHNDWTATRTCFHSLLMGKVLLGIGSYNKHTCFVADTPVWTSQGVKTIDTVGVGDYVPTHNGRLCPVIKIFKNNRENRTLYAVHTVFGHVATATHDHPFLVYSTEYNQILWKPVHELKSDTDYLMRSNLTGLHSFHLFSPLKQYPTLNRFLHKHPRIVGVSISRIMGNHGIVDFKHHEIKDCLENLPNEELTIYEDMIILLTNIQIRMIIWKWVLETNHYVLVKGWWDAFESKTFFVSKEEAEMVMIVLNLYNFDVIVKKPKWSSQWCLMKRHPHVFCCLRRNNMLFLGDKVFVRFSHNQKYRGQQKHPFVYTLAINRDHSFTVNGYVVKNCSGATPDTMVMTEDCLVPIANLQPGDYVLDKTYQKRKIRSVIKNHYEGPIISLHNSCLFTASTQIYKSNKKDTQSADAIMAHEAIASPVICYYYSAHTDQQYPTQILNFILRYLCDWDIGEDHDWCHWKTSISDNLWVRPVLSAFHCFQYKIQEDQIQIKKEPLLSFIGNHLKDLLHISIHKLKYFFSYLDRAGSNRLSHEQSHFCNTLRSFLMEETIIQRQNYIGEIYDLDMEGDGFCTAAAMVQKDFKTAIGNQSWQQASYLYIPDRFFNYINRDCEWDNQRQVSDMWQEIVATQVQTGKPSILCDDRNKNECVSGDTRILTRNGIVTISSKKDEIVSVWNGSHFTDVMITRTGHEKKFLRIHLSNGLCLTCTPYHKLYIMSAENNIVKVNASDVVCGDEIAPFQLPSISTIDMLPSSIIMTLEWIAKRCVHIENDVVLFDRDIESLKDILLDLQYCGLKSEIVSNPHRNEYELRIDKTRWNLLNYRHLNKNISYIEGDTVREVKIIKKEETHQYQESYCFHEPFSGTSIFEGVATGQCEDLSDVVCVQGFVDVSKFLKTNPLKKQLRNHHVIVYTTQQCPFLRLLRREYDDLQVREIETWEEEWEIKRHVHALSSVPAIFLDNLYVGSYMDFWKHYLCPVLDTENLRQTVYCVCQGLDNAIDQEKNVANEFCFLSNRPIVLRVRGFLEVLLHMKLSLEEADTQQLNKVIFETIHYAALKASSDMASKKGPCINSDKIYSVFEKMVAPHENLNQNILNHGLRNMIYIRSCQDEEDHIRERSFLYFKQHLGDTEVPNSLRTIYQDEYGTCQKQRLQLMLDRKKYNVSDETFHLYLHEDVPEHELSELQQQIWSEGFHKIQIHHRKINN